MPYVYNCTRPIVFLVVSSFRITILTKIRVGRVLNLLRFVEIVNCRPFTFVTQTPTMVPLIVSKYASVHQFVHLFNIANTNRLKAMGAFVRATCLQPNPKVTIVVGNAIDMDFYAMVCIVSYLLLA